MKPGKPELKRFKTACEKLIAMCGMVHWVRTYRLNEKEKYAGTYFDLEKLHADFQLTSRVLDEKAVQVFRSPEHMAIHEVGHLLACECTILISDEVEAEKQEEILVQRFENMICSMLTARQIRALGE